MTTKQIQIMTTVIRGNADGSFMDLDQVLECLQYKTTKQSIQFSIRALISKGALSKKPRENRRGRSRVVISPTRDGYAAMQG